MLGIWWRVFIDGINIQSDVVADMYWVYLNSMWAFSTRVLQIDLMFGVQITSSSCSFTVHSTIAEITLAPSSSQRSETLPYKPYTNATLIRTFWTHDTAMSKAHHSRRTHGTGCLYFHPQELCFIHPPGWGLGHGEPKFVGRTSSRFAY